MPKRRKKVEKPAKRFCGYCNHTYLSKESEFSEHQYDCEGEQMMWYKERKKFESIDDDNLGNDLERESK